jgi:hypothetical protein
MASWSLEIRTPPQGPAGARRLVHVCSANSVVCLVAGYYLLFYRVQPQKSVACTLLLGNKGVVHRSMSRGEVYTRLRVGDRVILLTGENAATFGGFFVAEYDAPPPQTAAATVGKPPPPYLIRENYFTVKLQSHDTYFASINNWNDINNSFQTTLNRTMFSYFINITNTPFRRTIPISLANNVLRSFAVYRVTPLWFVDFNMRIQPTAIAPEMSLAARIREYRDANPTHVYTFTFVIDSQPKPPADTFKLAVDSPTAPVAYALTILINETLLAADIAIDSSLSIVEERRSSFGGGSMPWDGDIETRLKYYRLSYATLNSPYSYAFTHNDFLQITKLKKIINECSCDW